MLGRGNAAAHLELVHITEDLVLSHDLDRELRLETLRVHLGCVQLRLRVLQLILHTH